MHEMSVSHTQIQGLFFFLGGGGGGGRGGLPENNSDNFLALNLNILHFTVLKYFAVF